MKLNELLKEKNELELALNDINKKIEEVNEYLQEASENYYSFLGKRKELSDKFFSQMKIYAEEIESLKELKFKFEEDLMIIENKIKNYFKNDEKNLSDKNKNQIKNHSTEKIDNNFIIKRIIENIDLIKKDFKNISRISKLTGISKSTISRRFKDIIYFITPLAQELKDLLYDAEIELFFKYLINMITKENRKTEAKTYQLKDNINY